MKEKIDSLIEEEIDNKEDNSIDVELGKIMDLNIKKEDLDSREKKLLFMEMLQKKERSD